MTSIAATAFWVCIGFVLYVVVGYPALLYALSMRCSRPVRKSWHPSRVSILLPVHNGERWIVQKLGTIRELDYPPSLIQIVVVDDGSTDRTAELVRKSTLSGIELVATARQGKACALNTALSRAHGEVLLFTDVRQRLDPGCLRSLVECLGDPSVGVASGELLILSGETQQEADISMYWRYEKWIRRRLSRLDSVPGATGCLYAMRRQLAGVLPDDTILDDVHLPLAAYFRGHRVVFDESARAYDYPTSLGSEFRRKVRTQAGVWQVLFRFPRLLVPASAMSFHFASHKLGRLLLPYAVLMVAAGSFFVPQNLARAAILAQVAFYSLAAADSLIPARHVLKRGSSMARTVVVLLAAALCSLPYLIVNRGRAGWSTTEVSKPARE